MINSQHHQQYTFIQVPRLYYKYDKIMPCKYGCGKQLFIALVEIPDRPGIRRRVPFEVDGRQFKHDCPNNKPDTFSLRSA